VDTTADGEVFNSAIAMAISEGLELEKALGEPVKDALKQRQSKKSIVFVCFIRNPY